MPQEGYAGLAAMCAARKWPLYFLRPKLHLFGHIPKIVYFQQSLCRLIEL